MPFQIYTLSNPETDELRYVGKTAMGLEERLRHHIWPSSLKEQTYRAAWIRGLLAKGLRPKIELLEEHQDQVAMDEAEVFWIEQFRALGFRLVNTSDGGDGWSKGKKRGPMSDAGKKARSEALKGRPKPARTAEHARNSARAQGGRAFMDQHGVRYETVAEAARVLGVCRASIRNVLEGRRPSVKSLNLRYVQEKE